MQPCVEACNFEPMNSSAVMCIIIRRLYIFAPGVSAHNRMYIIHRRLRACCVSYIYIRLLIVLPEEEEEEEGVLRAVEIDKLDAIRRDGRRTRKVHRISRAKRSRRVIGSLQKCVCRIGDAVAVAETVSNAAARYK